MGLLNAFKQYVRDAMPGGALNPEVTPQGLLDTAALGTAPVPIVGDVLGLLADGKRLRDNPEERTPTNFALAGLGALPFIPSMAGMFVGKGSKTWDVLNATKAQEMANKGVDPKTIWKETGTFKGPDGMWRQEIDDSGALFNASTVGGKKVENDLVVGMNGMDLGPTVGGILDHPKLNAAYPGGVTQSTMIGNKNTLFGDGVHGSYSHGALTVNAPAKAADARSTTLHELQHAIQDKEGFALGGNSKFAFNDKRAFDILKGIKQKMLAPMSVDDYAKNAWQSDVVTPEILADYKKSYLKSMKITPELDRAAQETAAREYYKRLAGEAEARATQARMNMNMAQRREVFPLDSYDVPIDQLIVRGGLLNVGR
jgi:hypothetical protein